MGRPLWSTVYNTSVQESVTKGPGKWNPNDPFDPDSDAFFANAEFEVPIAEATSTELNALSAFDWDSRGSADRRRDMLDGMARRRRAEALDSIRRARAVIDSRRQVLRDENSAPSAHASSSTTALSISNAPAPTASSGRPISPLGSETESDDDLFIMQFADPESLIRPPRTSSSTERATSYRNHAANLEPSEIRDRIRAVQDRVQGSRRRLVDILRLDRERVRQLDRELRNVDRNRQAQRREEGSSQSSGRPLSRQRRDLLHSTLRSRTSAPESSTTTVGSAGTPEAGPTSDFEAEEEIRRSVEIARSVFRRQRLREIEARNRSLITP